MPGLCTSLRSWPAGDQVLTSQGLQVLSADLSPQAFRHPLSLALLIHHNVEQEKIIFLVYGDVKRYDSKRPHPLMFSVTEVQELQGPQAAQGGASLDMALPGHLTAYSVWHYSLAVKLRQQAC